MSETMLLPSLQLLKLHVAVNQQKKTKYTFRVKYLTRDPVVQYLCQTTLTKVFLGVGSQRCEAAASYTGICISEYSSMHSRSSSFGSASSESSWKTDGDVEVNTSKGKYVSWAFSVATLNSALKVLYTFGCFFIESGWFLLLSQLLLCCNFMY